MNLHGIYFHSWHFLYTQIQLTTWFGNVVAGVVVFVVVDICWQLFLKKWLKKALAQIHREELERHHREVVKPEADARHQEALQLARDHHAEHLAETKRTARRAKTHIKENP